MSNAVLHIEHVSKQYKLGEVGTGTISHDLNRWWHKIRGKQDPYLKIGDSNDRSKTGGEYVWALKDVSFEVKQGEVLGIIGKNGAGKSTLLKILSQVTSPTSGVFKAKGRIASLLEVGTGFHPELTGRENVYLNGAILGMTKHEIIRKFDEIVEFSGCAKYVDTPVKRYSSGMMVRLGFAVAAHLEPEILIVDEVLAVGDAEFQDKCIGKMKDVAGQGRTILFVSHNLASIKSLCNRALLLNKGGVELDGSVPNVIQQYMSTSLEINQNGEIPEDHLSFRDPDFKYTSFKLLNKSGNTSDSVLYRDPLILNLEVLSQKPFKNLILDIRINSMEGIELIHISNIYDAHNPMEMIAEGKTKITCEIENTLQPGKYYFTLGAHLSDGTTLYYNENFYGFQVLPVSDNENKGYIYNFKMGYIHFNSKWQIIP